MSPQDNRPDNEPNDPTNGPAPNDPADSSGEVAELVSALEHEQRNARPADLVRAKASEVPVTPPISAGAISVLLVIGSLFFNWIAFSSPPREEAAIMFVIGAVFCQFLLGVSWLGLGNSPSIVRLISVPIFIGLTLLSLSSDGERMDGKQFLQAVATGTFVLSMAALPLGMLKLFGFRVMIPLVDRKLSEKAAVTSTDQPSAAHGEDVGGSQFTIWQILGWTATVALFLGLMRAAASGQSGELEFLRAGPLGMILLFAVLLPIDLVLFTALWAMLNRREIELRWMIPMGLAELFITGLVVFGGGSSEAGEAWIKGSIVMQAALLATMFVLLLYRKAGYRLIRLTRKNIAVQEAPHALDE